MSKEFNAARDRHKSLTRELERLGSEKKAAHDAFEEACRIHQEAGKRKAEAQRALQSAVQRYKNMEGRVKGAKREMESAVLAGTQIPTVTDHAVVRYLERAMGVDIPRYRIEYTEEKGVPARFDKQLVAFLRKRGVDIGEVKEAILTPRLRRFLKNGVGGVLPMNREETLWAAVNEGTVITIKTQKDDAF